MKPAETQGHFFISHDQLSLASSIADKVGFAVLPNREICVAGVKMAGQLMPKDASGQLKFLFGLWTWVTPIMQSCTQAPNAKRYNMITHTHTNKQYYHI